MVAAGEGQRPRIVIILGPTAAGKSKLGIDLAEALGGEIINADSMQVYRYMDIGTAKPTTNNFFLKKSIKKTWTPIVNGLPMSP